MPDGADEVDEIERGLRRRSSRNRVIGIVAAVGVLGLVGSVAASRLRLVAEEAAAADEGEPWPHEGVDLRAVHAELVPGWYLTAGAPQADPTEVAAARARLWAALESSPGLVERATALEAALAQDGLAGTEAEDAAVDAWNAHMEQIGAPFALRLPLNPTIRLQSPLVMGYELLGGGNASVDGRPLPWVLANRLDTIGVRESYHGVVEEGAPYAFVLTARIAEDALNRAWPLLATGERGPMPQAVAQHVALDAAWAPAVAAELQAVLDPDAFAQLSRLADHRRAIVDVQTTTDLRTAHCGEGMALQVLPLRGWDPTEIDGWAPAVGPESSCTALFQREFDALRDGSVALRAASGLRQSAGALVAATAAEIVVHELRHVADAGTPPACAECPAWLSEEERGELSAYLDALRSAPLPSLQMHAMCTAMLNGRRTARVGAFMVEELLEGDCTRVPPDLQQRATALDQRLYGPRGTITVTPAVPATLPTRTVWGD